MMQDLVYRTLELLCAVVSAVPMGTNLGLWHLLWMPVSGRLLTARGQRADITQLLGWLYENAYLGQCQSLTRKVPLGKP